MFYHQTHCEQRRVVTTSGKGGYTIVVQNIHGVMPSHSEEHHEVVFNLNTTIQGMHMYICDLEGMAQANADLTRFNSAVMTQLAQMSVTLNSMKERLRILSSATTSQTRSKRKYYWWICGSIYTHGSKTHLAKKSGHREEAYYKKRLGGRRKGYEWWLGSIINKTEISNPRIVVVNCIGTPPNYPSNNMP